MAEQSAWWDRGRIVISSCGQNGSDRVRRNQMKFFSGRGGLCVCMGIISKGSKFPFANNSVARLLLPRVAAQNRRRSPSISVLDLVGIGDSTPCALRLITASVGHILCGCVNVTYHRLSRSDERVLTISPQVQETCRLETTSKTEDLHRGERASYPRGE